MGKQKGAGTHPKQKGVPVKSKKRTLRETPQQISFWVRTHKFLSSAIAFGGFFLTLLAVYPWLYIQRGEQLDPRNPFSEMFDVINSGYVPVTNLGAWCEMSFTDAHGNQFDSFNVPFPNFADYLGHQGEVTIPCFKAITYGNYPAIPDGVKMRIGISYAFYHLNLSFLRRQQNFHLQSVVGRDGQHHWQMLS